MAREDSMKLRGQNILKSVRQCTAMLLQGQRLVGASRVGVINASAARGQGESQA